MGRRAAWMVVGLLIVVLSWGCTKTVDGQPRALPLRDVDQSLIEDYFEQSNAAAQEGPAAQKQFLERTQHPDVRRQCDLGELIVLLDPSLSTLRPDDDWRLAGADEPPRGRVYVIAVIVTVQRDGATLGNQVGSMHLVVLDGTAYGFAPCPT